MDTRKNQATMSSTEKQAFVQAMLALKNDVPSQLGLKNRYDDYVQIHIDSMMADPGWAHQGPAFCPWHRVLLRNLELDLQKVDPSVTLPYWDWTVDQDPQGKNSPWTDDFLGGDGDPGQDGKVLTGPFGADAGRWPLSILDEGAPEFLARQFATTVPTLPTADNVQGALTEVPYDASPWTRGSQPSFRDRLEGWHGAGSVHNRVHLWVGGSMLAGTSPNDPVFFLHHCNIDRLWGEWQRKFPNQGYLPTTADADAPVGHRLTDPMQPWGGAVTVESALDYKAMGFRYDTDPAPETKVLEAAEAAVPVYTLPDWHHTPSPPGSHMHMDGPMFDLSPEDKAAGGHVQGAGGHGGHGGMHGMSGMHGAMFDTSAEDKAAGGHDQGR
jgi:tyrosinase